MTAPAAAGGAPDVGAARAALLARRDLRGPAFCRALADAADAWLAQLFAEATGAGEGYALAAVGGYGRRELAPYSDLDVVLLHDGRRDVAAAAERLWYPVWDAGAKLGHAVRTLKEALALAAVDLDTATSLLTARHLAGDGDLTAQLAGRARGQWRKRSPRLLDELAGRVRSRHAEAGDLAFLLEPDLKEARGGLRDVHALQWAGAARPVLAAGDEPTLGGAGEVLLAARVELHRAAGRPGDVLVLERQDEVAEALGDDGADALMARLAATARSVAWIADEAWGRVGSSLTGPLGRVFRRDRPLGTGLVLRDGEVALTAEADPAHDPVLVLRAGAAAARAAARLERSSLDRLAAATPPYGTAPWPAGARPALVDLLAAGPPAVAVLDALDQRDLLTTVLPEWASVRSRPQRNPYHRFTVDRHLCEAAAHAADHTGAVDRPDLLLVGAWLHDLGKGWPDRDHTDVGVERMEAVAARMGFDDADVATLAAMVRHHLLLADVATRRDLADDATITRVAETVGSTELLRLLAALTEADSRATGPAAWSAWKAELVGELTRRVAHVLGGGEAGEVTGEDFPPAGLRALMRPGTVVVRGEGSTLTVVAPDRPGLFSRVAGALALTATSVLSADAHSEDGVALSVLRVQPDHAGPLDWERVAAAVRRALEGALAVDARVAERARTARPFRAPPPPPPRVRVDNGASAAATVVEVHAPDGVGTLYRITRALADLDLDLRHAKVQTLGAEVVDSFYVRDVRGGRVTDPDRLRELERAVLAALASG